MWLDQKGSKRFTLKEVHRFGYETATPPGKYGNLSRRKVYRRRRRVFKANKENEEASGREKYFKLTRIL